MFVAVHYQLIIDSWFLQTITNKQTRWDSSCAWPCAWWRAPAPRRSSSGTLRPSTTAPGERCSPSTRRRWWSRTSHTTEPVSETVLSRFEKLDQIPNLFGFRKMTEYKNTELFQGLTLFFGLVPRARPPMSLMRPRPRSWPTPTWSPATTSTGTSPPPSWRARPRSRSPWGFLTTWQSVTSSGSLCMKGNFPLTLDTSSSP